MKKLYFLLLLLISVSILMGGTKVVPLNELMKPQSLVMDDSNLYISENENVFIYSLKDLKLVKKFGKKGEGPQEFTISPIGLLLSTTQDQLVIDSKGKVSFFKKDGSYVKELKAVHPHRRFSAIGPDKYIGQRFLVENKIGYYTINIYDEKLNMVKEVCRQENIVQKGKMRVLTKRLKAYIGDDGNIYVQGLDDDMVIHVYDNTGKKLRSISHKYQRMKVIDEHKEQVLNRYRRHPIFKNMMDQIKKEIVYPELLPAVWRVVVNDGKLYVLTYERKDGKSKVYIFDAKTGKFLESVMVTFINEDLTEVSPFTIYKGKIYQVAENSDTEKWELNIIPIK